jgi:GTP-binding protein SAR1
MVLDSRRENRHPIVSFPWSLVVLFGIMATSFLYSTWESLWKSLLAALGLHGKSGTLLLLGIDNSGKTTLLHRLRTHAIQSLEPTDRPSLSDTFTVQGITFQAWDLGGHEAVRYLWQDYVATASAILFLVDASDSDRLEEAGYELEELIGEGVVADLPIALLLNKCDLPNAMSSSEICQRIQYGDMMQQHGDDKIRVFRISVLQGEGYADAFTWISKFL